MQKYSVARLNDDDVEDGRDRLLGIAVASIPSRTKQRKLRRALLAGQLQGIGALESRGAAGIRGKLGPRKLSGAKVKLERWNCGVQLSARSISRWSGACLFDGLQMFGNGITNPTGPSNPLAAVELSLCARAIYGLGHIGLYIEGNSDFLRHGKISAL